MSNRIEGRVKEIGETGNLITDVSNDQLNSAPSDESFKLSVGGYDTLGLYNSNHDEPTGTMVASKGDSGFLEIEIVGVSISEMLGLKVDEIVEIQW